VTRRRLRSAIVLGLAILALALGAARTHQVLDRTSPDGTTPLQVTEPTLVEAACVGAVGRDERGNLTGDPILWGNTAGAACPT
jgi:hypothetical protein